MTGKRIKKSSNNTKKKAFLYKDGKKAVEDYYNESGRLDSLIDNLDDFKDALDKPHEEFKEALSSSNKSKLDKALRKETEEEESKNDDEIAFIPDYDPAISIDANLENVSKNPGKQARFLASTCNEVLYAGTRGSAKSAALIVDPLRYCANKNFRGLLIRKSMPDLRELILRCKDLYPKAFPGTKFKTQSNTFVFPSGATLEFGYCDGEDDLERYRGQEYTWVGIDEVAQYPGPWVVDRLKASMRSTDPTLPISLRCTCNPFGPGKGWVKKRWNIQFEHQTKIGNYEEVQTQTFETFLGEMKTTRTWFFGDISDNKVLLYHNPNYLATLHAIPDKNLRDAELYGSWDTNEGAAFPEFRRSVHIVEPFLIPENWYKWKACDWGYSTMAVTLWAAADWDDNVYIYRELATTGVLADDFANKMLELEGNEVISEKFLDGSAWSQRGEMGETPGDTIDRVDKGWTPADRSPGSRAAGKQTLHQYLQIDPVIDKSKLRIFSTCTEFINELETVQLDPNNPEDIDRSKKTKLPDHAIDAARYLLHTHPDRAVNSSVSPFLAAFDDTDDTVDEHFISHFR